MDHIEIIIKEARPYAPNPNRGTGNWLREKFSPSGIKRWFAEGLISDYASKMEVLREVDDNISRWLGDLDARAKEINNALKANRLIDLGNQIRFLYNELSSVKLEGSKIEETAEEALREFDKQAGLLDDVKRRWVYEKLETNKRRLRREKLQSLVKFVQKTILKLKLVLHKMGVARAHGDIGKYIDCLHQVSAIQAELGKEFIPIYNEYLKPLIDEEFQDSAVRVQERMEQEKKDKPKTDVPNIIPSMPISPAPVAPLPASSESPLETTMTEVPDMTGPDNDNNTFLQQLKQEGWGSKIKPPVEDETTDEDITETDKDPITASIASFKLIKQHCQFLDGLAKIAEVDKKEIPAFILSYSAKLEKTDPDASLKLLAIAEGLIGD
jgi:ribosomal protein S21